MKLKNPKETLTPGGLSPGLTAAVKTALFLLTITLFVYCIIVARNFLYPLAFGALFTYLLFPLVNFLEKKHFPRILAILSAIFVALLVIAVLFFLLYNQMTRMFEEFDQLKQSVNSNIEILQKNLTSLFGIKDNGIEDFLKQQVNLFFDAGGGGIRKAFSATTGTIFRIVILPIYVFLFLFYRTKFAYFILKIVPQESKKVTIDILRDISTVAARYMGGVTIVVLILSVINSTGLVIIGVEYAILLGIISALFNYIPYFGTLMGGLVPFLFVLLTTDDPLYYGVRVAILFLVVQFTENYILTPNIVGGNVRISPLAIIIGLIIGGMVWGVPGLLVIVPFIAILKIIFNHIPIYKPYGYLLGLKGTKKHGINFSKLRKVFHIRK